tara:strand:+ start:41851 stop:41958 length:108 start_codon:yes stop_codon:yes gene_type:complete
MIDYNSDAITEEEMLREADQELKEQLKSLFLEEAE